MERPPPPSGHYAASWVLASVEGQEPEQQYLHVRGLVVAIDGEQYLSVGEDGACPGGRIIDGDGAESQQPMVVVEAHGKLAIAVSVARAVDRQQAAFLERDNVAVKAGVNLLGRRIRL